MKKLAPANTNPADRTQAGNINIPVIGFGGSNGLTPVPGSFLAFAKAIGPLVQFLQRNSQ
jgi:hypothetical protein